MPKTTPAPVGLHNPLERTLVYRGALRIVSIACVAVSCLAAVSLVFNYILLTRPDQHHFFGLTTDLRVVEMPPVSDAVLTNSQVEAWAGRAVLDIYAFDFLNYTQQLARSGAQYFTAAGFKEFDTELGVSGLIELVRKEQYVSKLALDGVPLVTRSAIYRGSYVWEVKIPVLHTLTNNRTAATRRYNFILIITRDNSLPSRQYIAIQQWRQESR
jgi:hypothetical protein